MAAEQVQVEISELARHRTREAAGVVARALADNPTQIAIHGDDPERRIRSLEAVGRSILGSRSTPALVARQNGRIVGVASAGAPGTCTPSVWQQIRALPLFFRIGRETAERITTFGAAWAKHEPAERHWHLGPVAVEPHMQGQGIGSRMMAAFCQQMNGVGGRVYLETDKPENVCFYRRFGFEVIDEGNIGGVKHWFMRREFTPRSGD